MPKTVLGAGDIVENKIAKGPKEGNRIRQYRDSFFPTSNTQTLDKGMFTMFEYTVKSKSNKTLPGARTR